MNLPEDPISLTADLKCVRISEIILQTSRYDDLSRWYKAVLGVKPYFEKSERPAPAAVKSGSKGVRASDVRLCFFRLQMDYPYTQTFGIFEIPGLGDKPTIDPGLNHMQFRHDSLDQVVTRYERLRGAGITPYRVANHGPGSSFYYNDPDGNVVELSANNFATEAEYLAYFQSESFKRNPSGIDVDPETYVKRFRSGIPLEEFRLIPA